MIRKATIADIETLIRLRLDYLRDASGGLTAEVEKTIGCQLATYYKMHLNRDFLAELAEINNNVVATAFLVIVEKPANPTFITGKTGTVLNVFTYPEYRKMGWATKVIKQLIAEAKKLEVSSLDLLATPDGKPLYEKLGFGEPKDTAMKLRLV